MTCLCFSVSSLLRLLLFLMSDTHLPPETLCGLSAWCGRLHFPGFRYLQTSPSHPHHSSVDKQLLPKRHTLAVLGYTCLNSSPSRARPLSRELSVSPHPPQRILWPARLRRSGSAAHGAPGPPTAALPHWRLNKESLGGATLPCMACSPYFVHNVIFRVIRPVGPSGSFLSLFFSEAST